MSNAKLSNRILDTMAICNLSEWFRRKFLIVQKFFCLSCQINSYTAIHSHTHSNTNTHTHSYTYTQAHTNTHVHMHTHTHTHIHTYLYSYNMRVRTLTQPEGTGKENSCGVIKDQIFWGRRIFSSQSFDEKTKCLYAWGLWFFKNYSVLVLLREIKKKYSNQ